MHGLFPGILASESCNGKSRLFAAPSVELRRRLGITAFSFKPSWLTSFNFSALVWRLRFRLPESDSKTRNSYLDLKRQVRRRDWSPYVSESLLFWEDWLLLGFSTSPSHKSTMNLATF